MKILISDPLAPEGVAMLEQEPGFEPHVRTGLSAAELESIIGDYAGIIVRSATKVTRAVIEKGAKLKVIGRAGMGLDNIDLVAAREKNIRVLNTPGASSVAVAELTLAFLLALCRRIPAADRSMKSGKWEKKLFKGTELRNKTLGLVGLGRIGREVAYRALAFGMKVKAYDPFVTRSSVEPKEVELVSLEELLADSDFISIHAPLTKETRGLIGRESLAKMKQGVYLVNCARGGIIDEEAVLEALDSGKVAGFALDVYENEPPGLTPLIAHERVVASPHIGASTAEAQLEVSLDIVRQVIAFLKSQPK